MDMKYLVDQAIKENPWLNGTAIYEDGDIFGAIAQLEKWERVIVVDDMRELYNMLKEGYEGAYLYKNFLIFEDYHFGTFVYYISQGEPLFAEHLTMDEMEFSTFKKVLNYVEFVHKK